MFSLDRPRYVFLFLSLISVLIRFPFFFRDYIDRDESTFILMGQAWTDGFLPYTYLWDVKPPLTFLYFAISIFIFGKSIFLIRLFGALIVALTAYLTYLITRKYSTARAAVFAGVACILLQSLFGSIQGVMSEHLLMAAYMGALYLLTTSWERKNLLLAGVMLGISLMIKISIAFPILLLGLYLIYVFYREWGIGDMITRILVLSLSALAIVILTLLPYYTTGQPYIWWESVVLAPLAYTEAGRTPISKILVLCLPVIVFIIWALKKGRFDNDKRKIALIVLSELGLLLSFLKGGRINSHYLIQLYPPLLILLGIAFAPGLKKLNKRAIQWILVVAFLLPAESYLEYWSIAKYRYERGTFFNGEGFSVPHYIKDQQLDTQGILFLGYHIGYWFLDQYPPTKTATHPSNICKAEMFPYYNPERETAIEELRYIMEEVRPPLVVTRTNRSVFDKLLVEENIYIDSILKTNYSLRERVDNADIYQRSY